MSACESCQSEPVLGIKLTKDDEGGRKKLACTWIEVMRKNPELVDKMRNDRLTEADLFELKKQFSTIIAVMTRQALPYRVGAVS